MAENELVITQMYDVTTVSFRKSTLLDGLTVETLGKDLYVLVDEQARRKIVLDFAAVRLLSSRMIGVLIDLHKKAQAIKGRVVICALRPELKKVFKIMRLEKVLSFADDEAEAMKLLGAAPRA